MAAVTRWVQYDISAVGEASDGDNGCKGQRGYSEATGSVGDTFNIGPTTNRLYLNFGAESGNITLYSGTNLDARFLAKDITEKIHSTWGTTEETKRAICVWENDQNNGNHYVIYSGEMGSGSQVTVASGSNSAHSVLGWNTKNELGGTDTHSQGAYVFGGTVSVSGTYYGFQPEVYKIVISNDNDATRGIGAASQGGSNTYAGTLTTGGVYNAPSDITYTLIIDTTNGTTMGAGTGFVPMLSWTSTGSTDDSAQDVELLYPNHWYYVGTKGLMVKFTDAVFNSVNPAWTIPCYKPDYANGTNTSAPAGTAEFVFSSNRGDMSSSPIPTSSGSFVSLGSRGLEVKFNPSGGSDNLGAGDEFLILCSAPDATDGSSNQTPNITSLNYGNVTVSTESSVKSVNFEIESGAIQMSSVKFGLQNHGTFSHHNDGNSDTYFRFGTVGPGNVNGKGSITGIEWYPNIAAGDIDSDTPPDYLYATEDNLPVVSTADSSEAIGNVGLAADPMWVNIRLGAAETGANSTINYRLYFDYS